MNVTDTPPPLRLVGVSVRFGDRVALNAVDLTVGPGEFVALAGPNGSGKTTLLRAVLGLLVPQEGSIELFGLPAARHSVLARARKVAWVPQEETPRDNVRLFDYVLYGRYPHRGTLDSESESDRAIAASVIDSVGLGDRANDGVLSLSGGERQRAILARALAQTTPLLLLDEPTAHLDIGHQLDLLARVRGLSRERGVTVVAAIHDLNLAARFADRIVVLSHGRLVADGPPTEVLSEELLAHVWSISADLRREPRSGLPYLIPHYLIAAPAREPGSNAFGPVHVVGGGGSAGPYLRALVDKGFRVSTGVLALLDSDAETADALGLSTAIEAPFAPLGPNSRERNRTLLSAARAIVVAPFPVGPSNLANLEDLVPYVGRVPIYLAVPPPITARDFADGKAIAIYQQLKEGGAEEVTQVEGLLRVLRPTATGASPRVTSRADPAEPPRQG